MFPCTFATFELLAHAALSVFSSSSQRLCLHACSRHNVVLMFKVVSMFIEVLECMLYMCHMLTSFEAWQLRAFAGVHCQHQFAFPQVQLGSLACPLQCQSAVCLAAPSVVAVTPRDPLH